MYIGQWQLLHKSFSICSYNEMAYSLNISLWNFVYTDWNILAIRNTNYCPILSSLGCQSFRYLPGWSVFTGSIVCVYNVWKLCGLMDPKPQKFSCRILLSIFQLYTDSQYTYCCLLLSVFSFNRCCNGERAQHFTALRWKLHIARALICSVYGWCRQKKLLSDIEIVI